MKDLEKQGNHPPPPLKTPKYLPPEPPYLLLEQTKGKNYRQRLLPAPDVLPKTHPPFLDWTGANREELFFAPSPLCDVFFVEVSVGRRRYEIQLWLEIQPFLSSANTLRKMATKSRLRDEEDGFARVGRSVRLEGSHLEKIEGTMRVQ